MRRPSEAPHSTAARPGPDPSSALANRLPAALLLLTLLLAGCASVARQASNAYLKIDALISPKAVEIELDRRFIERYRNRVTITTDIVVDAAMAEPNGRLFDGDLHAAGRAPAIGLPIVLEIANAADEREAMDLIRRLSGTPRSIGVSGVWRIWPEHAGGEAEVQGGPVERPKTSYPPHVFEIHPATRIGGIDLRRSFHPVEGYRPGSARSTIEAFTKAMATIRTTATTIAVTTPTNLYNDLHFVMEIEPRWPLVVTDGRFLLGTVRDREGQILVEHVRMVFAKGTPPEAIARRLRPGDRRHVWAMPRIDYDAIYRRARQPSRTAASLPFELVILGVYED